MGKIITIIVVILIIIGAYYLLRDTSPETDNDILNGEPLDSNNATSTATTSEASVEATVNVKD